LAELVYPFIQEINLEDYKVDFGSAVSLKDLIDGIGPEPNEKELDEETEKEIVKCPECGHEFIP